MPLRSRLSRAAAALVFASLDACGGGSGGGGASSPPLDDLARYVDPMIGTLGSGNVIPGPSLPHGFVKLSPDTNAGTGDIDAYEYANDKIEAFSHTHLEGPGGSFNGYSQLGVMAVVGNPGFTESAYAQRFSHASEVAGARLLRRPPSTTRACAPSSPPRHASASIATRSRPPTARGS
ncbi:MAG: hypothetical protein IPK07_27545 [Deltaproteobacteria bacterium]|nr:hypothetical protein [Deltaproteobacteria bacterium]